VAPEMRGEARKSERDGGDDATVEGSELGYDAC